MKFSNRFKIFWWIIVLIGTTVFLIIRFENLVTGTGNTIDSFLFLLWIILILCPIFSEISILGFGVKKDIEELKNSTQLHIMNLRNEIQNKFSLSQTLNINQSNTPTPQYMENAEATAGTFNTMEKKILSTLWHYQKLHNKDDETQRWTFGVHPYAPEYPEYLEAISKLIKRRLVSIHPDTYQCLLTSIGIEFLKNHTELQTEDNLFTF